MKGMYFSDVIIFFIKIVWRKGKIIFEKKRCFPKCIFLTLHFILFTCRDIYVNLHTKTKR